MEIAQYANRLTGIQDIELFDRHGAEVEEKCFENLNAALDMVIEKWEQKRADYEKLVTTIYAKEAMKK